MTLWKGIEHPRRRQWTFGAVLFWPTETALGDVGVKPEGATMLGD